MEEYVPPPTKHHWSIRKEESRATYYTWSGYYADKEICRGDIISYNLEYQRKYYGNVGKLFYDT